MERNTARNLVLIAATAAFMAACHRPERGPGGADVGRAGAGGAAASGAPGTEVKMEWKGQYGGPVASATRVAKTAAEWTALWGEIGQPAPAADLKAHFAAAVFMGQRPTGGWTVRFHEPEVQAGELVVRYEVLAPKGFVTQAFTQPYVVRLFPKTDLPIKLAEVGNP